ncbi:aminopeptidase P N-terminal domain-containing protein [Acidithiobacillus caldus]|jgi:Xaa-Pro aminopeptidase|uniref:Xaa-Pro aminopeptidase n=1 Tax=Acidithiobacillus caldus (strain ATCC 51756 / DSM 8584 / KU) TaxID=637389 RepID=A0A059ZRQ5_ACICK|nr:aminopeptidase P N-terminal domain-containing protein [Acidithiobacillus caldus]AIA54330.1 Xaa-Pro aminopeptidase [Acidithiobacillus caldus ATCC 51756]MBU2728723.1 M24 family metallopeptidase [Acidithiobacillus caldus]MBU2734701.1 M24 family metallopeptidase [Acidithiobacillus caldus ATCC 51756]MBU2744320.1 M24 family metallopeptidase [Acidithiobacillus caldus]MBU2762256.1 M24 family metallopeptidase [Acidithiobacillus caldus]
MSSHDLPRPDYAARRRRLMERLPDGVAIVPTATEKSRNADVHYPFRPDSDFWYLTGFAEPEALLVLVPGHPDGEEWLFCRPRDPEREIWDGRRAGLEGARELCGIQQTRSIAELDSLLPELLRNRELLCAPLGRSADFDARLMLWRNQARSRSRAGIRYPQELVDLGFLLHEMRVIKDPVEQEHLRAAVGISAAGHRHGMRVCRPGMTEYQLQAEIEFVFQRLGARSVAYPSIVGGGPNACILHYTENRDALADGDLVLVDAGAEYGNYAGDITRSYPVNGVFSPAQREVYALVLASQKAAIAALAPGRSVADYHEAAVAVLVDGLRDLKILSESRETILEQGLYRSFYMHRTGHWLGLDVHDAGSYRQRDGNWRMLEPGMVVTVEPGLYFSLENPACPERYRGIGIRIEDDCLITAEGVEVLSAAAPKEIDEIEALMALGG